MLELSIFFCTLSFLRNKDLLHFYALQLTHILFRLTYSFAFCKIVAFKSLTRHSVDTLSSFFKYSQYQKLFLVTLEAL